MISLSLSERFALIQKLVSVKPSVAQAMTDEFFAHHPDWLVRYGERGRQFCTADACFHIEFLAGAIEADSPQAFADYSRWTARMLASRGIPAHTLEENLAQLEKHLSTALLPNEATTVSTFLARGREACLQPDSPPGVQPPGSRLQLTRDVFLAALLGGQRQAALGIVEEALRSGHSILDVYVDVFTESLYRVGDLWEQNKISVAQEHLATSITQYAIAALYRQMVPAQVKRGSMVVTGVAGELHQIGANIVADAMEAEGWTVRFLGTNLPHSSILTTVRDISANVLCISTTILSNLPSVVALMETVRSQLQDQTPKIVLGGAAYRMATHFASEVGATAVVTDLRGALALLAPGRIASS
ncbi:MAG: B12-binding domain-containing protein [Candidatus Korobacteraceae bacterium]